MPMLVLRPRSVLERVLDATKVLLLPGLAWALASAAALLAPPPAPAWATLAPPLAVVALLALAWRRSAAARRALEAEVQRARLTPRERQVALLAVRGLTYREIGQELQVTSSTIKQHLRCVYDKLDVTGRAELPGRLLGVDLTLAGT